MSEQVFFCREGQLWYRDWCWSDDDIARKRMEDMAVLFETGRYPDLDLAAQCRKALQEFDAYHLEEIDA